MPSDSNARPVYRLHVQTPRLEGVDELHGVVTELDTRPNQDWQQLQADAVERWETYLNPPGSTASLEERIEVMLGETGWEAAPGASVQDRLVWRRRAGFRTQLLGDQVAVLTRETGDLVDLCPVEGADLTGALEQVGWEVGDQLDGWTRDVCTVQPRDWTLVLERVRQTRDRLRAEAAAQESGWRELIRAAVLSGVPTQHLTSLTGLTRQRIYQIRDRRR